MQRLAKLIVQMAQIAFVSLVIATNSASAQVKPDLEPSDPYWKQRTEMLASYKFSSNKTIEPGVSVRLKKSVSTTSEPRRTDYQAVLISSIEYADGTIWRADKVKK